MFAVSLIDGGLLAFIAVSALLIITPGPDMALVTRNAVRADRRAASLTAFGVGAGILVWELASMLGIAVLLERSVIAFTVLKLAGAAYLVYLSLRSVRGSDHTDEGRGARSRRESKALPDRAAFQQGFFGNLLNPKAGLIFVSIVPQFIHPGDSPLRLVLVLLAFEVMLVTWLNLYGFLISHVGQSAAIRIRRAIGRVTGVVLIALGVRLAFEHR